MILQEFPDLGWLKSQIAQRFRQRKGYNNVPLDTAGFPSVVIHTKVKEAYRPDIEGPVSIFMNLAGSSYCQVEGRTVSIPEDYYFISNRSQHYSLTIESKQPVETFNIHFGEHFSEGVLGGLITATDSMLDNGTQQHGRAVTFHNRLYKKGDQFNRLVAAMLQLNTGKEFDKLLFEELLEGLLRHLFLQHRDILTAMDKLPSLKRSVKVELFKRLSFAADYIHSNQHLQIDLSELASTACLSKFHFLRLFKLVYGHSPHQYIQQLRLEKAIRLLGDSSLPVGTIAELVGFENSQSFSRLFHQRMGLYPSQF